MIENGTYLRVLTSTVTAVPWNRYPVEVRATSGNAITVILDPGTVKVALQGGAVMRPVVLTAESHRLCRLELATFARDGANVFNATPGRAEVR